MTKGNSRKYVLIAVFTAICAAISVPVSAQETGDLEQKNSQLTSQVTDLTKQLQTANQRITQLERQLERLNRALEQARAVPGESTNLPTEGEVTIDESKPEASPRAFLAALTKDYQEAVKDVEPGEISSRKRIAYLRVVDRWTASANRKFKSKIKWYVKLAETPLSSRPTRLKLTAVDPETHTELGEPFIVPLSSQNLRRLEQLEKNGNLDVFVLRGVLTPKIKFDDQIEKPGPFGKPLLVGMFALYRYSIEPQIFTAVADQDNEGE